MKKIVSLLLCLIVCLGIFAACGNGTDDYVPAGFKQIAAEEADYRLYVPDDWTVDMSTGVTSAFVSEKDRSNISFMGFALDDSIIHVDVNRGTEENTTGATNEAPETSLPETSLPETTVPTEDASSSTEGTVPTTEPVTEAPVGTTDGGVSEVPDIETLEEYWAYYSAEFSRTFPDMEYSVEGENMLVSGRSAKKYVYTATVTGQQYKFMQVITIKAGTVYILTYTATVDNFDTHLEDVNSILGYLELK